MCFFLQKNMTLTLIITRSFLRRSHRPPPSPPHCPPGTPALVPSPCSWRRRVTTVASSGFTRNKKAKSAHFQLSTRIDDENQISIKENNKSDVFHESNLVQLSFQLAHFSVGFLPYLTAAPSSDSSMSVLQMINL